VFGSCPRHTVKPRGAGVGDGTGGRISAGVSVASGWEDKSLQAESTREMEKRHNRILKVRFEKYMAKSFFRKSTCPLYKQAAHLGGL